MDVFTAKNEKLTVDGPLSYKSCSEFVAPMKSGDKLEFRVGDASAGTFSVADLPNNDAVLLLVVHRHDTLSTAVSFQSHVFANLLNAQVAVIDTYKGTAKSSPRISDGDSSKGPVKRSEDLRYNSVVAVNPGFYQVSLDDTDGKTQSKSELVAVNRESYVIVRAGVEAQQGPSYPQELIIFPKSDPALLSGAVRTGVLTILSA